MVNLTIPTGIAEAPDDEGVWVTGKRNGKLDNNRIVGTYDMFLTKVNASGNATLLGAQFEGTHTNGLAVDPKTGHAWAVGVTHQRCGLVSSVTDLHLTKFDASGNVLFSTQLGVANMTTVGTGVTLDQRGNVFVVGYTNTDLDGKKLMGKQDIFVAMFDSGGKKLLTRLVGVKDISMRGLGITTNSDGNAIAVGSADTMIQGNSADVEVPGLQGISATKFGGGSLLSVAHSQQAQKS